MIRNEREPRFFDKRFILEVSRVCAVVFVSVTDNDLLTCYLYQTLGRENLKPMGRLNAPAIGSSFEEAVKMEDSPKRTALYEKLRLPISELELSVRSSNCLREANIKIISDLVKRGEEEMLGFKNFGKKSLTEIKELLAGMGLALGMQIDPKKLKKV